MISLAMFFWQCRASAVTMHLASSSARSNSGMAVISLRLFLTLRWPNRRPLSVAQALTITRGSSPWLSARRTVLPSSATTLSASEVV